MQKIILSICISVIVISIFYILIPNKNMASTMKFALNIFLVSIIVVPILKNITNIDLSNYSKILEKNDTYKEDLKDKVKNSNKIILQNALKTVFYKNGYNDLDISIDIDREGKTNSITIKLSPNKNYNVKNIEEIVKNQTGISPKIEYV